RGRRLLFELFAPRVLAIERDRIGKEFFEHLRRDRRGIELFQPVLFRGVQKHAEAVDLVQYLGASKRGRLEQVIEYVCGETANNQRNARRQRNKTAQSIKRQDKAADERNREGRIEER